MRATRSIGTIAVVALAATLVAGIGVAAARAPAAAPARQTFALYSEDDGIVQGFKLRNREGSEASITVAKDRLTDVHGQAVGLHHWQCLGSSLADYCTGAIVLDAPQTGAGSIIVAGLFEGFNGESLAVTGGTGAFAGARGTAVLTVKDGRYVRTIKLIP